MSCEITFILVFNQVLEPRGEKTIACDVNCSLLGGTKVMDLTAFATDRLELPVLRVVHLTFQHQH
jgi:hypothetical protein